MNPDTAATLGMKLSLQNRPSSEVGATSMSISKIMLNAIASRGLDKTTYSKEACVKLCKRVRETRGL